MPTLLDLPSWQSRIRGHTNNEIKHRRRKPDRCLAASQGPTHGLYTKFSTGSPHDVIVGLLRDYVAPVTDVGAGTPVIPVIDVRDPRFGGAKGDGVTDDTAAIQAAINTISPGQTGTVLIPVGIY